MYILGVHMLGPNTGACILKDDKLIAMAEEERFCRVKTATDFMPVRTIKYCLNTAGITLRNVDCIVTGWDLSLYPEKYKNIAISRYPKMMRRDIILTEIMSMKCEYEKVRDELKFALRAVGIFDPIPPLKYVPHHLSHAAATYYTSSFNDSLILTVDGSGEYQSTVLWRAEGSQIEKIQEWLLPHSLGWFYAAITEFLGFRANSGEGKVMGLAPYGQEDLELRDKLRKIVSITPDGYEIDATYIYFGNHGHRARFTDKLISLLGDPHNPEKIEYSEKHKNLAYEAQRLLEEVVIHIVKTGFKKVKSRNLCVSGGVAMNCKLNGVLGALEEVDNIYVFPVANDAGTALGAALYYYYKNHGERLSINKVTHAYWGPEYTNDEIDRILKNLKLNAEYCDLIEKRTAEELWKGKFVGWFQGRMEIGARALGNRSILANPTIEGVKDRINAEVKHREPFRPFAPTIIDEEKEKYTKSSRPEPFMIQAFVATDKLKREAPAVVHIDNTVRPQFLREETNPRYYRLIREFEKLSGVPVLLNTSFNIGEEPIVCSPEDAIRCFFGTGLDVLVLGNYFIKKD